MKKEMLINVLQPEECRIAIVEDGILEELYVERTSHESYTGNIYKGKVVNLEPAIQAGFVDFSVGRNGFLHVSDVEPQYYRRNLADDAEPTARDRDREREPRARDDRRRPARPAGPEARDLPAPPSYPEERIVRDRPERDRPDRSERGRRDRSEPRRFGEGLVGDDDRPAPPSRPEPGEAPRRLRSEVPPAPARPVEPPPYARSPERFETARPPEPEEPRARGFGSGVSRPVEPEPFDPDLPPSRTQRGRTQPARPVEPVEDLPRARTTAPAAPAREPDADLEPEPAAREPRRGRGGRGRGRAVPESRVEPEPLTLPESAEPEDVEPPFVEEAPRRRGGRDAIRSRGGDREPERPRPAPPEREPERPRPAPPERSRGFAAELIEPERPRPAPPEREPERPRPAPPERSRGFAAELIEPERPRPAPPEREPERPRPAPPERSRGFAAELIEPERPRPAPPERTRPAPAEPTRERGRSPERPRAEIETPRDRNKPIDRAGEEGYVPRRLRSADPTEVEPPSFPWADSDEDVAGLLDSDVEGEGEAEDFEPGSTKADGTRRRRRRRGRRRDREPVEVSTPPVAEEIDELEPHEEAEDAEIHGSAIEEIPSTSDFDFGEERGDDEFEDEDDLAPSARIPGPEDEIDPELEEEIRKEIEEIAELERQMGLRGTVEARPRRGDAGAEEEGSRGGRSAGRGMVKPPIQEIFRRGDEVLVQVIKESIGTKGPTLSTYISIPGRYLVLMPGLNRVGVSRKIADEGQRRKLREIMNELNPPKGLGFIVRTAGLDRTKRELARDLAYLLRLWKVILTRIKKAKTPAPIYQESDMITRTIRDIFTAEIDTIWIDEPAAFERAQEFLRVVMPRFVGRLKLYDEKVPIFHKYGIEDEIAKIQRRRVDLPEGGSIVIDQTEALVAIDVNSGNFRVENDAERTAYEMNLRAAKEIARQLRLRDLGGVIVNDFIDMRDERNRRGVEKALRDAIKRDRARTKVLRMSAFGLIEMTRQRIRPSLKRSVYEDCVRCAGAGVVKTVESMSIDVMRILALASHREDIRRVHIGVTPGVAAHLNNRKRKEIAQIELDANMTIHIRNEEDAPAEHLQIDCFDANNNEVRLFPQAVPDRHHRHRH
ncbi:Rne/Rng family ribonuclease [Tundrisphaera lichenicola]|uniref:Rne/Rng family ribonuclease n=1 Tax=Tundrisphaera lichenicola TaxID=2029860 RepID=UPI003EBDC599